MKNLTREQLASHLKISDACRMGDANELTALALACWVRDEDILHVVGVVTSGSSSYGGR